MPWRVPVLFRSLLLVPLLAANLAMAQLTLEMHLGTSAKPPTTLEIRQEGHPTTTIGNVRYETRAWVPGTTLATLTQNYYSVRVGYHPRPAREGAIDFGVELELLHDKAYYVSGDDPDGVVQHFELSDGINYLLLNAVARRSIGVTPDFPHGRLQLLTRVGAAPVVTAPSSTIRGRPQGHDLHGTGRGYQLAGFGLQAAVQVRRFVLPWLALSAEGKFTYSATRQRIADGTAATRLPTFHIDLGLTFVP